MFGLKTIFINVFNVNKGTNIASTLFTFINSSPVLFITFTISSCVSGTSCLSVSLFLAGSTVLQKKTRSVCLNFKPVSSSIFAYCSSQMRKQNESSLTNYESPCLCHRSLAGSTSGPTAWWNDAQGAEQRDVFHSGRNSLYKCKISKATDLFSLWCPLTWSHFFNLSWHPPMGPCASSILSTSMTTEMTGWLTGQLTRHSRQFVGESDLSTAPGRIQG